jgi:hypothetical protein
LNGVENADGTEISGEREVSTLELGFRRGHRFQVGTAGAADCFEAAGDIYSLVKLLGLEESIVSSIEILTLDVQAGKGKALSGRLLDALLRGADFTHPLSQFDGTSVQFEGRPQALDSLIGRAVLHEELRIEQSRFYFADVLGL